MTTANKTTPDDFTRLHARAEGKAEPPLLHAFVRHLDVVAGLADPTEAERRRDALARLERERPDLHQAVVMMAAPGAKLRLVAPTLGVSMARVSQRRTQGLRLLKEFLRAEDAERAA